MWDNEQGKQYRTEMVAETLQFGSRTKNDDTHAVSEVEHPREEINPDDIGVLMNCSFEWSAVESRPAAAGFRFLS